MKWIAVHSPLRLVVVVCVIGVLTMAWRFAAQYLATLRPETARLKTAHDHDHHVEIGSSKPMSFTRAVHRLPRAVWLIANEFNSGHRDHALEAIEQLRDVLRWIPELAADTDLDESDWLRIRETCVQVDTIVQRWSVLSSQPTAGETDAVIGIIEHLRPLAEMTRQDIGDRRTFFESISETTP